MHWESLAIETGDPERPYLAQITFGTRKSRDVKQEWPAASLAEAQTQADDWLAEFSYRIGLATEEQIADADARLLRLARYKLAPGFSEKRPTKLPSIPKRRQEKAEAAAAPVQRDRPQPISQPRITKLVRAARAAGIVPAGVTVWPDGVIAVFDATATALMRERTEEPVETGGIPFD